MISSINKDKFYDYEGFVDKFKPKKTTDDCYTPPNVYEAIKDWVVNEYDLKGYEIVRPFYPGGDYKNYGYTEDCVVIDNPPFSILSEIKQFYISNDIKFFLFAPLLTLFEKNEASYIITNEIIVYENGARINTGFITNLEESFIRLSPSLRDAIREACNKRKHCNKRRKYVYPENLLTGPLIEKFVGKEEVRIYRNEVSNLIEKLDSQKKEGAKIYGKGYLVSDKVLERLKKSKNEEKPWIWELSDREKRLIQELNKESEKNKVLR